MRRVARRVTWHGGGRPMVIDGWQGRRTKITRRKCLAEGSALHALSPFFSTPLYFPCRCCCCCCHARAGACRRVRVAERFFRELLEAGITPDVQAINSLINAFSKAGSPDQALKVSFVDTERLDPWGFREWFGGLGVYLWAHRSRSGRAYMLSHSTSDPRCLVSGSRVNPFCPRL